MPAPGRGAQECKGDPFLVAERLGISPDEVLIASTGVIGAQLDMKKIEKAIPNW
jgi:N-acetylglutamate synthase/N-acetylornithine aminotransferase